MKFEKITLTNFKSYVGTHSFTFFNGNPGLFFVTGDNQAEPHLGSNGVGKSTLYDAIYWVLYGKTLRNLKAKDIAPWSVGKNASVELTFSLADGQHKVYRQWSPNKLTLDGKAVEQDAVTDAVGLSPTSFEHSVIIGQHNDMFFDLKPAQKLSLFSDVLGLEYWTERADAAKKGRDKYSREAQDAESEYNRWKARCETLEESIWSAKEQREDFEKRREADAKEHDREAKEQREQAKTYTEQAEEAEAQWSDADYRRQDIDREIEEIRLLLKEAREYRDQCQHKVADAKAKQNSIQEQKDHLRELPDVCPTCGQAVDENHVEDELVALEQKANKAVKRRKRAEEALSVAQQDVSDCEDALQEAQERREQALEKVRKAKSAAQRARDNERSALSAAERSERNAAKLREQENPFDKQIADYEDQLKKARKKQDKAEKEYQDAAKRAEAHDYWVNAFKDIRLEQIEQALRYLEVETNNSLVDLGLPGWEVHYDVERETASGGISRGFNTFIQSPHNNRDVPWEAWSGGEGQRLRLAGTMGLANLILSRCGVASSIEVYDEPSHHVNEQGVQNLLDALAKRAQTLQKQIYVVDHHSLSYGDFTATLNVVKDENGSRMV